MVWKRKKILTSCFSKMLGRDCSVVLRGWLYMNPLPNSSSWSSSNLCTPSRPTKRSPDNPSKYQQVGDLLACLLNGLCPGPRYSCIIAPFLYPLPVLSQTAFLTNETRPEVTCVTPWEKFSEQYIICPISCLLPQEQTLFQPGSLSDKNETQMNGHKA